MGSVHLFLKVTALFTVCAARVRQARVAPNTSQRLKAVRLKAVLPDGSDQRLHDVGVSRPQQSASVCVFLSSEGAQEAATSQIPEGQLPDGQWMTQSFADQIPDISGGPQDGSSG